ncbi:unnamed protein product [Symbiodinium sp. CCMP2592]|nr:unnamed protein product [Symbiodinium sp. CCMP2592]
MMRAAGRYRAARFDIRDGPHSSKQCKSNYMDLNSRSGFALAIFYILKLAGGDAYVHFGMKCSSFSSMNAASSGRSACSSTGFEEHVSVAYSNQLLERTILLILLATAMDSTWSLEQPGGSVLDFYPAWRSMMMVLSDWGGPYAVSKVRFWMGHFGAKTPKRHYMYANSVKVNLLNKGKLSFGLFKHNQKTAKYHVDANGIRRFSGTMHLRDTEQYPVAFAKNLVQICENLKKHRAGCPQTSEIPSALDTLSSLPSDYHRAEYENAALYEVYNYLRGSKSLAIPEEWRCILPPGFLGF